MEVKKLPELPEGTGIGIMVVVQYAEGVSIETWVKAIHDQTTEPFMRALYHAGCEAFAGDEAMLWALREATAAAKERLAPRPTPSCFTPTQSAIAAIPAMYRALQMFVRDVADNGLPPTQLEAHNAARAAIAAVEADANVTVN